MCRWTRFRKSANGQSIEAAKKAEVDDLDDLAAQLESVTVNDPKPVEPAGVSKKIVSEDKSEADEDKSLAAKQEEDHVEVDENEDEEDEEDDEDDEEDDEEDDDGSDDVARPSGPETYQMHPLYESCRPARVILCVGVIFPLPPSSAPLLELSRMLQAALPSTEDIAQLNSSVRIKLIYWCLVLGGIGAGGSPERLWYVEELRRFAEKYGLYAWNGM
ncbi:uncharacterized protein N7458_000235 [Penicillium daleae]|uniref:Uncharacterized protein n=1 Tax=Penicillium daleae TaxID=63821 RepID=A0AAD6G857_9EURO|nr:uncharacterized protein N7458_000235 [Penicillium daleae]KAJ5464549.1 hypothetical protein N7458_000235 [Penicillium daleae]